MIVYQCRRLLRQRRFLILTVIVTIMFLMYQLLSVGQLGKELSRRKPRSKLQTNFRSYEKADGFMQVKYPEEERDVNKVKVVNPHVNQLESWYIRHGNSAYMLGVLPVNQKLYLPSSKKTFKCIHSGEEIAFSLVNDDFCDCLDFSDEPSTSACNYGRFYCTHQPNQSKNPPLSIISYKVNDGICDCCDGSDEWKSASLPGHTIVKANKKFGLQIPCHSHCSF